MSKPKENEKIENQDKKPGEIDEVYEANDFDHLRVPPKISVKTIVIALLLALVMGGLGGFWGGLFILTSQRFTIPFLATWDFSEKLPKREIVVQTREEVTITQDDRLSELARRASSQIVKIFPARDLAELNIVSQIHLASQSTGQGFLLTNDGWVVTASEAVAKKDDYVAVTSDYLMHKIERIVTDPLINIAFLKLATAGYNFSVVGLAEKEKIVFGRKVFIFNDFDTVWLGYISDTRYREITATNDLVMSTEKLQEFLLLSDHFDSRLAGSPVFNLDGLVVGILQTSSPEGGEEGVQSGKRDSPSLSAATAVSANYLRSATEQLLKFGEIRRPRAGIDYLDLSRASGIVNPRFKDYKKGALLYGTPGLGTPGREAGLRNADLVIKVNNDIVNGRQTLTELIQEYMPGDTVEITFTRGEEEKVVKVELGEM